MRNQEKGAVKRVLTRSGEVGFPAYMPVTTFGGDYPTDRLIQPFLSRWAEITMVSLHHARTLNEKTALPTKALFIDSGGFACLLDGFDIARRDDGTGCIVKMVDGQVEETISPEGVLAMQERLADFGATLDFPIPPGVADDRERRRRLDLTLANAKWAIGKHRGPMVLFGSVQGHCVESYASCAAAMVRIGFQHLAIGGLVPRQRDAVLIEEIVKRIRPLLLRDGLLHVFGLGGPEQVRRLMQLGVTSVDSSSYVQAAASGKRWDGKPCFEAPTALEIAHAAAANLKYANSVLGLSGRLAGCS
jgi:helicase